MFSRLNELSERERLTLVDIQSALFSMLREVKNICSKNELGFYLWGGTLIGAMRNGDIIPWDDDMDIVMLRDDWERFSIIAPDLLPPEIELFNPFSFDEMHPFYDFIPGLIYKKAAGDFPRVLLTTMKSSLIFLL